MVDLLVVLGVGIVLPLAVGGRWAAWLLVAGGVAVAVSLPTGPLAGALVLPWMAVAVERVLARRPLTAALGGVEPFGELAAAGFAVVAAGALLASVLDVTLLGTDEPIIRLTAIHFTYAGAGTTALALSALRRARPGRQRVGPLVAVLLAVGAPPVVALGFVSGHAVPQVAGALLMTAAVWLVAVLQLGSVFLDRVDGRWPRVLLVVSGLAPWVPMVLAVAWAAGQHWDVPALSIPDMARLHGVANAVGFTLAGLLGRRLERPERACRPLVTAM